MDLTPAPGRRGLSERLRAWRNRLVADAGFQRRVARFPLTRRFARRQAEAMFQETSGFVRSQILFACVELDLCSLLAEEPLAPSEIGGRTGLPRASVDRLLPAARALNLVGEDRDGRWSLRDGGAVIHGNEGIRAMIRHHAMVYRDLADPVSLLRDPARGTETAAYWAYAGARAGEGVGAAEAGVYSALMRSSQDLVAGEVLDAYPMGRHRAVLDIGGGEGAFLAAAGARHDRLTLHGFDLPPVAERARAIMRDAGYGARYVAHGGNFFTDDIPPVADCVTLVRVLCDHDDAAAAALLRNIRRTIAPGATLLIAEPMDAGDTGGSLAAAYFGLYFVAMRSGRCRSPQHIESLLAEAGFESVRKVRTRNPLFASVISAKARREL